ncbi:hypothetical protein ACFE04_016729 [Oxalis oulophora]
MENATEPNTEVVDRTPPQSDVASDTSSSSNNLFASVDGSPYLFNSPTPSPSRDAQMQAASKSEEYRQLFRLPTDEILIQDYNCAFQESILLQGHMYLFLHFICFYSNIFGFETKRIIPFHQITSVKKAKTAGIFPTAIEIIAVEKKYFFASFLSRDEAFKLINDGWSQHGERQESLSENFQENGLGVTDKVNSSTRPVNELQSTDSDQRVSLPFNIENDTSPSVRVEDQVELVHEPPVNTISFSSSENTSSWRVEDTNAPSIPQEYTKVAETNFQIKVEEFFDLFFSDASSFKESFHAKCGDGDYKCSSWHPHDELEHVRDVSFQHPLKILFEGPKSGSCKEIQKYRVYRNSHLVVSTSQEITDIPYGDCFRVEGLWDICRRSDESEDGCILRIYVNVNFIKRTVWKGKIAQSTVDECRQTYAVWVNMAEEMLIEKNLEKQEEGDPAISSVTNGEVRLRKKSKTKERSSEKTGYENTMSQRNPGTMDLRQFIGDVLQRNIINVTSIASYVGICLRKIYSFLKRQSRTTLCLIIAITVILLMQVTILALLNRPQHISAAPQVDYAGGRMKDRASEIAWLEKRMHHLNDEVLFVERRLERMWQEQALLKAQIRDIESFHKHNIPLPPWVLEEISKNPELVYTDRSGRRNSEYTHHHDSF